jgi:hypothetical protein
MMKWAPIEGIAGTMTSREEKLEHFQVNDSISICLEYRI